MISRRQCTNLVAGMLLAIAHEWRPREAWERSMTLLSREVLPLLAKGNAS